MIKAKGFHRVIAVRKRNRLAAELKILDFEISLEKKLIDFIAKEKSRAEERLYSRSV